MKQSDNHIELAEDLKILAAYKASGKLEDITPFFQKYMAMIYGVSLKYLKDSEKSKDAVMDIYEKITKKLKTHEVSNPKSWLYTLTKNHCYEILRSKQRVMEKESSAQLMYSEEVFRPNIEDSKEGMLTQLESCIGQLENMQKQTVELFYLKKMTYKEICAKLEIEWSKARSLIQNGRRNLKICMEKKHESINEK